MSLPIHSKMGKATAPTKVGDLKMVVVKPDQQADTPMEIGKMKEASTGADFIPKPLVVSQMTIIEVCYLKY